MNPGLFDLPHTTVEACDPFARLLLLDNAVAASGPKGTGRKSAGARLPDHQLLSDLAINATQYEMAAMSIVLCSGSLSRDRFRFGYGSCAEPAINDAQSSGGFPCASILANTAYGSVLLPEDRKVPSSFIQI